MSINNFGDKEVNSVAKYIMARLLDDVNAKLPEYRKDPGLLKLYADYKAAVKARQMAQKACEDYVEKWANVNISLDQWDCDEDDVEQEPELRISEYQIEFPEATRAKLAFATQLMLTGKRKEAQSILKELSYIYKLHETPTKTQVNIDMYNDRRNKANIVVDKDFKNAKKKDDEAYEAEFDAEDDAPVEDEAEEPEAE